jgi:Flp pilus assembly pilin Flp
MSTFSRFLRTNCGATAIEYGILAALAVTGLILLIAQFTGK